MNNINPNILRTIVDEAISSINELDSYLIENDLSERCICARFALHLTKALENTSYNNYVVDVEYNRGACGKEDGIKKWMEIQLLSILSFINEAAILIMDSSI